MCLWRTTGYRQRLREKYFLPEEPCNDACTQCFCFPCALSQESRELKNRGWDPKLGTPHAWVPRVPLAFWPHPCSCHPLLFSLTLLLGWCQEGGRVEENHHMKRVRETLLVLFPSFFFLFFSMGPCSVLWFCVTVFSGFASNVRAFQARGQPPPPQRMGK